MDGKQMTIAQTTFSVMQWNVWCQEDIRKNVDYIRQINPDILCLQELTQQCPKSAVKDGPAYIAEQLGYYAHYKAAPVLHPHCNGALLADGIFSRFPLSDVSYSWISQPSTSNNKLKYCAYIQATTHIRNTPLCIGTTHLPYTNRFEETESKRQESDTLLNIIAQHPSRYIFAGDLNATPDSPTVKAITNVLENAGPNLQEASWSTKPFAFDDFTGDGLHWRLDYTFATPDLQVVTTNLLTTDLSDHLPILTTFRL